MVGNEDKPESTGEYPEERPTSQAEPGPSRVRYRIPQTNENTVQRRLECVLAVESGEITMSQACVAYDISSRTFYRWARSKSKLLELTTEKKEQAEAGSLTRQKIGDSASESKRTRIEVVRGERQKILVWYIGTQTEEIRTEITRFFGIDDAQWFLSNDDNEMVVVSPGIPSGTYHLNTFYEAQQHE